MASTAQESEWPQVPGGSRLTEVQHLGRGVAAQVRNERVDEIVTALKADDFDAARYENTPRLRAERLAQVLTRALSRGAMRRRLKSLGVSAQYSGGALTAISVEGGGLDIRRADGQGQVLTGPGLDARLLAVFPELLPHTLTNLTIQLFPGASDAAVSITQPATSGSNGLYVNLSLFVPGYLASGAVARYITSGTGIGPPGSTFSVAAWSDPFASGNTAAALGTPEIIDATWSAAGVNWIEINSGATNASPGSKALSFGVNGYTSWTCGLNFQYVTVTYTDPPCQTCTFNIQVSDGCDGSGVGGATVDLGAGYTCTTDGGGGCTISGIPDGTYDYTVSRLGYDDLTGTYTCECGGGETTLNIDLDPEGGCDNCDLTITVIDWCTGLPLAGVTITVDGVDVCTTDASGVCTFTGLENGDHEVVISRSGYASQTRTYRCTS